MKAKPGDTIEITKDNDFKGRKFIVVECPIERNDSVYLNCPWVEHDGQIVAVPKGAYKIIGRSVTIANTDEFLKRQLNANLDSIFS